MVFDEQLIVKIDKFLNENLDILFKFKFNGLLLLAGGALKGFIMDSPIKDYDFFLLTQDEDNIMEFIKKYRLDYKINPGRGYTINYNNLLVGINPVKDLSVAGGYNTDLLFYDIHRKQFIPFGIKHAIEKRQLIVYEYFGYPKKEKRVAMKKRLDTAKKFIQFMSKDGKRVKVIKKNKYFRRMFIGFLKKPSKIKKIFRR